VERKAISIMKACALVGVSRRTIYNWITAGKVEYVRTAGGSVRIFVDSLWRDPHAEHAAFGYRPRYRLLDAMAELAREYRQAAA